MIYRVYVLNSKFINLNHNFVGITGSISTNGSWHTQDNSARRAEWQHRNTIIASSAQHDHEGSLQDDGS